MTKNILIASIFLFGICLNAQEKKLVWEENFDGKVLNEKDWNFELGDGCPKMCGWGNNEKQIYSLTNIFALKWQNYIIIDAILK